MKFFNLFKRPVTVETRMCSCKQLVPLNLYKTKVKAHIIGSVNKYGKTLVLYCNGQESK